MMVWIAAGGVILGILLCGLSSALETASYTLNQVRLRVSEQQGQRRAADVLRLMTRHEDLVILTLIGTTVGEYGATACLTALLLHTVSSGAGELYATLILTPTLLLLAGILPKDLVQRRANAFMMWISPAARLVLQLARATGLIALLRAIARALTRLIGGSAQSRDALLSRAHVLRLVHEGAARGGLSVLQRDLIDRVMNLRNVRLASVMIPRQRAAMVERSISRQDFLRIARMAHFSRLPVYEKNPRRVIGIVNVYDVLTDTNSLPITEHVQPALQFSPAVRAPAALLAMQQQRQSMAIVVDGQGTFLGLLTIKDLVEEIVGELETW